jgi:hypothetical protein
MKKTRQPGRRYDKLEEDEATGNIVRKTIGEKRPAIGGSNQ